MAGTIIPGEYILAKEPIIANKNRKALKLVVKNTGDRPIQVGSHTHFFEVNKALDFDRKKALGFHLNIPAGTAIRFEPGDGLVQGSVQSESVRAKALRNAKKKHFKGA